MPSKETISARSRGKTITRLYADFEAAVAATKALPPLPEGALTDPDFDRAVGQCGKIAWRIVKAPARSLDEMLKKIAVAGWCVGAGQDLTELAEWQPGAWVDRNEEVYALATLRDDLKRLCPTEPAAPAM